MEITRQAKSLFNAQAEAAASAPRKSVAQVGTAAAVGQGATPLPVEQLQEALGQLPEVDLDKVDAIRQALQRGEIAVDSAALSRAMLAYHNGSDA